MIVIEILSIFWISFLAYKLSTIRANPQKYDRIPNYEQYRNSSWYWPEKKDHHKGDPPDLATRYAIPFFFGVALYYFLSTVCVLNFFVPRGGNTVRFIGNSGWLVVAYLLYALYALLLAFYFPLFFRSPEAICFSTFCIYPRRSRSEKWVKMSRFALVVALILMSFRFFALTHTGYASEKEIVYRPFWHISEQRFVYDELIDIQYETGKDGVSHCYIMNTNGQRFDLFGSYVDLDHPHKETRESFLQLLPEEQCERILNLSQKE